MATVRPFKGYRPLPEYASHVASKPYDVLNSEEARLEAAGNPLSFLHVGKPEIDLPPGTDLYDERVYARGKENLRRLIDQGILREDDQPYFYLYAQTMGDHTQFGIMGCVSVKEYLNDTIKKHELTRKDKEDDRTKHVKVTNAHSGPIFLTYHARREIDALVAGIKATPPTNNFVAEDGIRHQLWVIQDRDLIDRIAGEFRKVSHLYVADGHHRSAAAARVGKEMADANPKHRGDEEYNFFLAVLFPHNQLRILDYNRVVKDLNGRTPEAFIGELKKTFRVQESPSPVKPSKKGDFGMYLGEKWYTVTAPPELLTSTDPVERLDVSVL